MIKKITALFILFFIPAQAFQFQFQESPGKKLNLFLLDEKIISANKTKLKNGDKFLSFSYNKLLSMAEAALSMGPYSVTYKKRIPPSGDRHDYLSYGPYWWPDSSKPDGLPYKKYDGLVNPEIYDDTDKRSYVEMCEAVYLLSIAYYFSDEEKFAGHAALLLRVWFLDDETKMNPNFNYGQAIPGISEGRPVGLIEARHFTQIIESIGFIQNSKHWSKSDDEELRKWFEEYFTWLTENVLGKKEAHASNNHGTWYDVQAGTIALYLGKEDFAKELFEKAKSKRIDAQIKSDGAQPEELARTRALSYSAFNLQALFSLAKIAEKVNVDLWNYQSPNGGSILKAFNFILPYALGEKEFPYQQITSFEEKDFYPLLLAYNSKTNSMDGEILNEQKLKFKSSLYNLLFYK